MLFRMPDILFKSKYNISYRILKKQALFLKEQQLKSNQLRVTCHRRVLLDEIERHLV